MVWGVKNKLALGANFAYHAYKNLSSNRRRFDSLDILVTVRMLTLMRIVNFSSVMAALALLVFAPLAEAQALPKVTVVQAGEMDFIGRVAITGTLVARDEVMVNPRIGGQQIMSINADIGQQVVQGQILAQLDRETLAVQVAQAQAEQQRAEAGVLQAHAQVALAQASLDSAQTTYERDQTLLASGTVTQAKFDGSNTAFRTAEASVTAAQQGLAVASAQVKQAEIRKNLAALNLSYADIVAPAAGVISARNASVGAVAAAGPNPMFQIIRDNLIEVHTEVIETDIARISVGDTATLRVAGLGPLTGTVRLISPRVNARTRLGEVRISLPKNNNLRIGVFATGWISTEQYRAIGIPASAVLSDADGAYTQVVNGEGIIEKRRVETGLVWGGMREIRSGLAGGDTVVLLSGAFFRDGDRIIPILEGGATR